MLIYYTDDKVIATLKYFDVKNAQVSLQKIITCKRKKLGKKKQE
jgi:hypothetical protein